MKNIFNIVLTSDEIKVLLEAINEYGEICDNYNWYRDIKILESIEDKINTEKHENKDIMKTNKLICY